MTAKEYLEQLKIYNQAVQVKAGEVEEYKTLATKVTQAWHGLPPDKNARGSNLEWWYAKLVDERKELDYLVDRFCTFREEVLALLAKLDDPTHSALLNLRYVQFKSWQEVASEMSFSHQHVYRLSSDAHKEVEIKLQKLKDESK